MIRCFRETLKKEDVEEILRIRDQNGFTALTLAARLSHKDYMVFGKEMLEPLINICGSTLIRLEVDAYGMNIYDECIYQKNNELIEFLFKHQASNYFAKVNKRLALAQKLFNQLPDFSIDLSWEIVSSVIPLIQNVLPHDTMKFIKIGKEFRVDFKNIKLWHKPEYSMVSQNPLKQNFSLIFRDGDKYPASKISDKPMNLLLLDWDNLQYTDMLGELISDEQILLTRRVVSHKRFICNYLDEIDTEIEPSTNMFGFQKHIKIDGNYCKEYNYANKFKYNKTLFQFFDQQTYEELSTMSENEYFSDYAKDRLLNQKQQESYEEDKFTGQVWLAENFPIKFDSFLNMIETLLFLMPESISSNAFKFLQSQKKLHLLCKKDMFPLQFKIPLFYSLSVVTKLTNLKMIDQEKDKNKYQGYFSVPEEFFPETRREQLLRLEKSGFQGKIFQKFQYQDMQKL
ncbi:UNKNOWN [Stylonychia lemnae]|uniref:Ankyrin repeat domain-containing protein n=1 Tax=Stylonychia lemnae TaxID=5949 RepID=A0A078ALX6_STYLE|nr:UNKNOWN [Stylonychia lemnae]|eukprot:CDW81863.1 UNKNOWN [Stylonychia lemnae]